jgi:putative endonuclease
VASDLRHLLGHEGERIAALHLERRGLDVLARRYRTRWGELDLVGFDGRTLVFCEVKTRRGGSRTPFEAITADKARRVRRMAAAWLTDETDRPYGAELRFDAIAVTFDARGRFTGLEHLENCF